MGITHVQIKMGYLNLKEEYILVFDWYYRYSLHEQKNHKPQRNLTC